MRGGVTDTGQPTEQTVKIELLSQWKLEAEFRNLIFKGHKNGLISSDLEAVRYPWMLGDVGAI